MRVAIGSDHAGFELKSGEARHLRRLAKVTALENPLRALAVFGQSVWLDYIRRSRSRAALQAAMFAALQ